jgi:lipopolysaccharide/colanic/teichoic acid biosynthesis glycosyltransferase
MTIHPFALHCVWVPEVQVPRYMEIIIAVAGLVVLSPLFLLLALGVKLSDGGPVFYRARRIGREGAEFSLLKFRSMVVGADKKGGGITTKGDTRVTPMGVFLRRFKLDEIPQLLNILAGDMSFVGARPEDPRYVALYTPEQLRVLAFRPGITSPASIHYRNEETLLTGAEWEKKYVEEILPFKLSLELAYLPHKTTLSDVRIILKTVFLVGQQ